MTPRIYTDDSSDLRTPPEVAFGILPSDSLLTSFARLRAGMSCDQVDQLSTLPIRVAITADGNHFEVIDGFKRLDHWLSDGFTQIPVIFENPGPPTVQKKRMLEANSSKRTTVTKIQKT